MSRGYVYQLRFCKECCAQLPKEKQSPCVRCRFFKFVDKNGPIVREGLESCWMWTGAFMGHEPFKYGSFAGDSLPGITRSNRAAHRASWVIHYGPIPEGKWTLHKCDNTKCVRPDHLFLGTHTDNMADCVSKGRFTGMEKTHCNNGHPFTPENTYVWPKFPTRRQCRACNNMLTTVSQKERRARLPKVVIVRVCDAAVSVLRETKNPAVMVGDSFLLHEIANRAKIRSAQQGWKTEHNVIAALAKCPGDLISRMILGVHNKLVRIFYLPECAPKGDQ